MPALLVGHGRLMNAIEDHDVHPNCQALAARMPVPHAIALKTAEDRRIFFNATVQNAIAITSINRRALI